MRKGKKETGEKPIAKYPNLQRKAGPGRPKGVPNKATTEIKEFARSLLDRAKYRANLIRRLDSGKVHPTIESMMHHYAYGKPKEVVQVEGSESLGEILRAAMVRKEGSDGDSK
jgi:hypothetical protein